MLEDCATNAGIAVGESTEPLGIGNYWQQPPIGTAGNALAGRILCLNGLRGGSFASDRTSDLKSAQGKFFPGSSRREGSSFACETTYFKFGYLAQQYRTIWAVALTCQSEN
jgi:hypothetical protein